MTLRFYDSASASVRDFEPVTPGQARIYYCGATVQGAPHIGHVRSGLVFDQLSRWLTYRGYRVTLVRNVTDIDDKILANSEASFQPDFAGELPQEPWWALAYRFEQVFGRAYAALNIAPPTYEPRATGHIPEMFALIQRLIDRGHAYPALDGSGDVYFDVLSWPSYGELTRQQVADMQEAPDADPRGKRDPRDFALWKGAKPGEPESASWILDRNLVDKLSKTFIHDDFIDKLPFINEFFIKILKEEFSRMAGNFSRVDVEVNSGESKKRFESYQNIFKKEVDDQVDALAISLLLLYYINEKDFSHLLEDPEEFIGGSGFKNFCEDYRGPLSKILQHSYGLKGGVDDFDTRVENRARDLVNVNIVNRVRCLLDEWGIHSSLLGSDSPLLKTGVDGPHGYLLMIDHYLQKFRENLFNLCKSILNFRVVGGRPGWHLECSAMAGKYLGETFDIHGGGLDLRFPHHENELAQSRAAGFGFANFWMHNGLVNYQGEKMSKSIGNIITPAQMLEQARPLVIRYYLGQAHYRSVLDYRPTSLEEAKVAVERVEAFLGQTLALHREDAQVPQAFAEAMDDDLNIPRALAVLHERVKAGNGLLAAGQEPAQEAAEVYAMVKVLGLLELMNLGGHGAGASGSAQEEKALASIMDSLLLMRDQARQAKDWAKADQIRDALAEAGITVRDSASGSSWSLLD